MKKSDITTKWSKALIPARVRLAGKNHPWLMAHEVEVGLKGEAARNSFAITAAVGHLIPVDEWPQRKK